MAISLSMEAYWLLEKTIGQAGIIDVDHIVDKNDGVTEDLKNLWYSALTGIVKNTRRTHY